MEGAQFLMSNICHVVWNSEHENREKNFSNNFFDRLMAIFGLRNFLPLLKCTANQDRPRGRFLGCVQNFVMIRPLWRTLLADNGRNWQ